MTGEQSRKQESGCTCGFDGYKDSRGGAMTREWRDRTNLQFTSSEARRWNTFT